MEDPDFIACLALGSRGDVEPLLAVCERIPNRNVVFACRSSVWSDINSFQSLFPQPCYKSLSFSPIRDCAAEMAIALNAKRSGAEYFGLPTSEVMEFEEGERRDMVFSLPPKDHRPTRKR